MNYCPKCGKKEGGLKVEVKDLKRVNKMYGKTVLSLKEKIRKLKAELNTKPITVDSPTVNPALDESAELLKLKEIMAKKDESLTLLQRESRMHFDYEDQLSQKITQLEKELAEVKNLSPPSPNSLFPQKTQSLFNQQKEVKQNDIPATL
jgi:hypothetical protein